MREEIINDIAKKVMIKLAKHEVELNLVDDLIKFYKDNSEQSNKASLILDKLLMETKIALNMYKEVQAGTDVLLSNIAKYQVKVKELGLDLPKEINSIVATSTAKQKNNLKIIAGITKGIQGLESANSL
jgi:hypothetical protein